MLPRAPVPHKPYADLRMVPLFHAAWIFAMGILLSHAVWLRPSWILLALVLMAVVCIVAAVRAQRTCWMPLAVLWCLLGWWCAQMEPYPAQNPALAEMSDGLLRSVEGTVADAGSLKGADESDSDDSPYVSEPNLTQRVDLQVINIERVTDREDIQVPAEGRIRLSVHLPSEAQQAPLHCGERVRATLRLLPSTVYRDPGVWNYADYLAGQGITSTASVDIQDIEHIDAPLTVSTHCHLSIWQHEASARLMALPAAMKRFPVPLRLSSDDAKMLTAMITGDRTYLNHSLRVGFERTGSFHMLVVAGFHLALVAGAVFWVARRIKLSRTAATLMTLLVSWIYALLTGFAIPVQRSLWMVTLYLLGQLIFRRRSPLNILGFASLCLLAASPRSLFDSGFQMTLLAVAGITCIAAPLLGWRIRPLHAALHNLQIKAMDARLPIFVAQFRVFVRMVASALQGATSKWLAWKVFPWCVRIALRGVEILVVSAVVEVAMTLPMAVYFHRITLFALPVNMLILPLLAVLVPTALLTLLVSVVWPAAATAPAMAVAFFLHIGVYLVHFFGGLQAGDVRIATPSIVQSTLFYLFLIASAILALRAGSYRRRWQLHVAWMVLFCAAIVVVIPRPISHPHNAMLFEAIDVGQGDSLLLITSEGKTLLVDGGGFGGGQRQSTQNFDIGEEVVSQALWARGIRHLDVVALSHAHSDHMGGLPAILHNFRPDELWVGNNPHTAAYDSLLAEAEQLHVSQHTLHAGDVRMLGSVRINVFAPLPNYQPGPDPSNNDSLVLRAAYKETSVLLEGDAEAPVEQLMLSEPDLASTLLKVGHHGSISSTTSEFLARVAPQWAVISCGRHNHYGHPREETLAALQEARVHTLRTDLSGAVCLVLDGKSITHSATCE